MPVIDHIPESDVSNCQIQNNLGREGKTFKMNNWTFSSWNFSPSWGNVSNKGLAGGDGQQEQAINSHQITVRVYSLCLTVVISWHVGTEQAGRKIWRDVLMIAVNYLTPPITIHFITAIWTTTNNYSTKKSLVIFTRSACNNRSQQSRELIIMQS